MRLFCFHYGGGSASIFKKWAQDLIPETELVAIQLPGREERFNEALLDNINDITNNLFLNFDYIDKPFIFFGHSIGALIAFEFARILRVKSQIQPEHLIVSGTKAPQTPLKKAPIHNLSEIQFIQELRKYNGIPNYILQDKEIMSIFMPIIRADFKVSEIYSYHHQPPMDFPITALGGSHDDTFDNNDLELWKEQTKIYFKQYTLEGDHFFINSSYPEVIKIVNQILYDKIRALVG
jgi:medium-chain acyl-[acyl-carrier-protein] hydrolase